MTETLSILNKLPTGILKLKAEELHTCLEGPTLIHLKGKQNPPLFISVLLHGNEHTSWEALRLLLSEYEHLELPRSLSIFVGNVHAAKENLRRLHDAFDFNRVWGTSTQSPHPLMQAVIDEMKSKQVYFSVDIHNNTGRNPHYACVNKLDRDFLYLANLFSKNVVYFIKPEGVQSMAFAKFCPAVTVECGISGDQAGTHHAYEFLKSCLHLSEFPNKTLPQNDLLIYHTVAVVKINPRYRFCFDNYPSENNSEIYLDPNLDSLNFSEIGPGKIIGLVNKGIDQPLMVQSEDGQDVTDKYIGVEENLITIKRRVIPSMLTLDTDVITKDCLCYFMEYWPSQNLTGEYS